MPYIKSEERNRFLSALIDFPVPNNAGELNYLITTLCHKYIKEKGEKYQHYNDILGALEGVKLELYRRRIADYENIKISDNGDV